MSQLKNDLKGLGMGLLMAFTYSLMAIFVKMAENIPNETIVFYRALFFLPMILPWGMKKKWKLKTNKFPLHLLRTVTGLLSVYCYFYTLKNLSLVDSILLANTVPLFIPLLIWIWLKEKVPVKRLMAAVVGFLGVVLILNPVGGFEQNIAIIVGLGTAIFAAISLVSIRLLTKHDSTFTILFYFSVLSVVIAFFPLLIWGKVFWVEGGFFPLLYITISAFLYQYFLAKTYTYLPASKAASLLYFSLIFGGFFDWWLWGKIPSPTTYLGMVLVVASGLLVLYERPRLKIK